METQITQETERLPLIPLRGLVVFPDTVVTVDIGRERSLHALETAMSKDGRVFLVAQRDSMTDHPAITDLYTVGVIVNVKQVAQQPDFVTRALVEGQTRAILTQVLEGADMQEAEIAPQPEDELPAATSMSKSIMRTCLMLAQRILRARNTPMQEMIHAVEGEKNPTVFCDVLAAGVLKGVEERQKVLESFDVTQRLELLLKLLSEEMEMTELDDRIQQRVREYMDRANHEYYLREQIHAIQDELNEGEDEDIVELRQKLAASKMHEEAREKVEKELRRLARTSVQAPESAVSQNYIEYMLDMPWGVYDNETIDLKFAKKVLEEDHFGMKEVKERLTEFLAVRAYTDHARSPILCLVGPPGVGKTSIAKSVARALKRKFVQLSLGGVHDEAEIRGHRKTYVGAMPGKIISSINQVKTMNPVFLLDEIDKMARDVHGDPASAMLEVLDPEQNKAFRDHYLEAAFDLSKVLFITTANTTESIDRALLDRMEIIEVPSYTLEEKVQIAKRHLVPKELAAHGLKKSQLRVSEKVLAAIIDGYTRESGVRNLERVIAKLCRKATVAYVEDPEREAISVKQSDLKEYLGAPQYLRPKTNEKPMIGVVNGLAWTSVGGEVMPIEAAVFAGKGNIELTGSLGDVMKESARLAKSVVRMRLREYGLEEDFFDKHDIHIHVPEGAVPKDGPSAGVALTCALMSAVGGRPARGDVAMTGEITLNGRVLPIGGVKEKLLAAHRMGIDEILLPAENEKDLEQIDAEILEKMTIRTVSDVDEALRLVLTERENEVRIAI